MKNLIFLVVKYMGRRVGEGSKSDEHQKRQN